MIYRGTVIKECKDHYVVFTKDCEYVRIKNDHKVSIGKQITFLEEDLIKMSKYHTKYMAIAAVFLLVFLPAAYFGLIREFHGQSNIYAVVSLDINPSVEFEIDNNQIVKRIIPVNEEGKDITSAHMKGLNIKEAIFEAINNAMEKEYLTNEHDMVLISEVKIKDKNQSDHDNSLKDQIIGSLEEKAFHQKIQVVYLLSDQNSFEKAREEKISIGKYQLYEKAAKVDSTIDLKELNISQITEIINKNEKLLSTYEIHEKSEESNGRNAGKQSNQEKVTGIEKDSYNEETMNTDGKQESRSWKENDAETEHGSKEESKDKEEDKTIEANKIKEENEDKPEIKFKEENEAKPEVKDKEENEAKTEVKDKEENGAKAEVKVQEESNAMAEEKGKVESRVKGESEDKNQSKSTEGNKGSKGGKGK